MTGTDRAEDKQSLGNRCSCPRGTGGDAGKLGIKGLGEGRAGRWEESQSSNPVGQEVSWKEGQVKIPGSKGTVP